MSTEVLDLKKALRARIRASLKELSAAERATASVGVRPFAATGNLAKRAFDSAFTPLPDELDIRPLWDAALALSKIVALPLCERIGCHVACCGRAVGQRSRQIWDYGTEGRRTHLAVEPTGLGVGTWSRVRFDWAAAGPQGLYDRLLGK